MGTKNIFVPNRRPASISLLSRSFYTKPPFFEEVAPINFSLFIYNENGTHSIHRKKNYRFSKKFHSILLKPDYIAECVISFGKDFQILGLLKISGKEFTTVNHSVVESIFQCLSPDLVDSLFTL